MFDAQLNMFDTAVLVVIFLSCIIAFFRGFVKEVLSLSAWVGAGIITMYAFPYTSELFEQHVKNPKLAGGVAGVVTFIVALLIISVINAFIIRYVREGAEIGLLDKFLGLIFGFARGAFIVSLGYLILSFMLPEEKDKQPEWIKTAKSRETVEIGALALLKIAPNYFNNMSALSKQAAQMQKRSGDKLDDATATAKEKMEGYSEKAKGDFERVMDSMRSMNKSDLEPEKQ